MNGAVIRIFKTRYDRDYNPDIDTIVSDKVMFYTHALLKDGLDNGTWYKIGSSMELGVNDMAEVLFGKTRQNIYIDCTTPVQSIEIDRLKYWLIWNVNKPKQELNNISTDISSKLYPGGIYPYSYILDVAEYGYYKNTAIEYEVIKRIPHDYANSYVKKRFFDIEYYFHFKGSKVEREIITGNNKCIKLSKHNPNSGLFRLSGIDFWEINWKYKDFISDVEFEQLWHNIES